MTESGIYAITSIKKPEKVYIGSAVDFKGRQRVHFHTLRHNKHHNGRLQNHYNKYGEADLTFTILYKCPVNDLIQAEQVFINVYEPFFNIYKIAGSPLGTKQSEEVCKAKSLRMSGKNSPMYGRTGELSPNYGKKFTEEHKRKIGDAQKWRTLTDGQKQHLREVNTGKKASEETKRKMSLAHSGEGNARYGAVLTDETKQKIGKANKGRHRGAKNPAARKVIDITTGIEYGCVLEAASMLGVGDVTIRRWIKGIGSRKNEFQYAS